MKMKTTTKLSYVSSTPKTSRGMEKLEGKDRAVSKPKTSEMVVKALKELKERKGSSVHAIKKYISAHYEINIEKTAPFIKKYLKSAVEAGQILQTKGKGAAGSFKLDPKVKLDKPSKKLKTKKIGERKPKGDKKDEEVKTKKTKEDGKIKVSKDKEKVVKEKKGKMEKKDKNKLVVKKPTKKPPSKQAKSNPISTPIKNKALARIAPKRLSVIPTPNTPTKKMQMKPKLPEHVKTDKVIKKKKTK